MNVVPEFKIVFLEYCFDKKIDVRNEIIREYAVDDSRPDFFFSDSDDNEYLIEVKLYDKNMHFDQYNNNKQLAKAEKSFIANYPWKCENGWKVKTWKGFVRCIMNSLETIDVNQRDLVAGYLGYLKKVINYIEANSMDISNLESIFSFYLCINEAMQSNQRVVFEEYNKTSSITADKYGKYSYFINKAGETVYLWYGIYFSEDVGVYLEFEYKYRDWVPEETTAKLERLGEGIYFDRPKEGESKFWIKLKDEYFHQLCSKEIGIEEQKEILFKFLDEVIQEIL